VQKLTHVPLAIAILLVKFVMLAVDWTFVLSILDCIMS